MSGLYNMLCGHSPVSQLVLSSLHLGTACVGRFRDTCISADGKLLTIYARIGGGNREEHESVWTRLRAHPQYVKDYDDPLDATYASIEFSTPSPELQHMFATLASTVQDAATHPTDRFARVMSKMQAHPAGAPTDDKELRNALLTGKAITSAVGDLKLGHTAKIQNDHGALDLVKLEGGMVVISSKD